MQGFVYRSGIAVSTALLLWQVEHTGQVDIVPETFYEVIKYEFLLRKWIHTR